MADVISIVPKQEAQDVLQKWVRDTVLPYLKLHPKSLIWYVRAKEKGKKPLFQSTGYGETQLSKARVKARELYLEWQKSKGGRVRDAQQTFAEYSPIALKSWCESGKLKASTLKKAEENIGQLNRYIGYAKLNEMTEVFLEDAIAAIRKEKIRELNELIARMNADNKVCRRTVRTTYSDYIKYALKVLRHAKRNGILDSIPSFESPDTKKETGRVYTKAEIGALTKALDDMLTEAKTCKEDGNKQKIRRVMALAIQFRCSFNAFMRLREHLCAPWSELDLGTGRWIIPPERWKNGSKTGQSKDFFVPKPLLVLLKEWRALNQDAVWIFPNPKDCSRPVWDNKHAWQTLKEKAGILGRARWHDLRHTALTWALLGDDELQAALEKMPEEERDKARSDSLKNPLHVAKYSGTSIRTIERVYLKVKAYHTKDVSEAIPFETGCEQGVKLDAKDGEGKDDVQK